MSDIAALILAGGVSSPEMRAASGGVANRALTVLAGRTMLDYVVAAVRAGIGEGARVLVAGDVPTPSGCVSAPGGASLVDTLLSGARALEAHETRLLVVTTDIPFLTSEAVADFLRQAAPQPAAFCYPIVRAELCAARFPGMKRTTLRIAEGTFTGGNLALLDPSFLRDHETTLRAAYARRKSVSGIAALLGPALLARLLASRVAPNLLRIGDLERAVGRVLGGASVRAIVSPFPELAADVDRPEDVAHAHEWLENAANTPQSA